MEKKLMSLCSILGLLHLFAYQSGDSAGFIVDELYWISRHTDFSVETHCQVTVANIIKHLIQDKLIEKGDSFRGNVCDLKKHNFYKLLFDAPTYSKCGLFTISICGGFHEFLVERTPVGWRIFQSWLDAFTLKEWVDGDLSKIDLKLWESDFKDYARGKEIDFDKLIAFINARVGEGRKNSSVKFAFTGFLPEDLEIAHYEWC